MLTFAQTLNPPSFILISADSLRYDVFRQRYTDDYPRVSKSKEILIYDQFGHRIQHLENDIVSGCASIWRSKVTQKASLLGVEAPCPIYR